MLRVISELRPRYVVAENVRGAVNLALDTVYSNLVNEGYKVYPYVIPASAVGAPHQRERLFVVGVREDVHRRYTEAMENPRCELRQGSSEQREMGRETSEGIASDTQFSSGSLWPTPMARDYKDSPGQKSIATPSPDYGATLPVAVYRERCGINSNTGSGAGLSKGNGGQLNPDWVEQLMNFPGGWTNLEVDEPSEWVGWPALLGERLWGTHVATLSVRTSKFIRDAVSPAEFVAGNMIADQYPYEFPRTTTGCKNRTKRLKALGNAVVPAQAYPFFRAIAEIEKLLREVIT